MVSITEVPAFSSELRGLTSCGDVLEGTTTEFTAFSSELRGSSSGDILVGRALFTEEKFCSYPKCMNPNFLSLILISLSLSKSIPLPSIRIFKNKLFRIKLCYTVKKFYLRQTLNFLFFDDLTNYYIFGKVFMKNGRSTFLIT